LHAPGVAGSLFHERPYFSSTWSIPEFTTVAHVKVELKPATKPHRVGTTRFSSSVQLKTTTMVAAVWSRDELFLIIKNR
jgi:hypothetical protein